MVGRGLCWAGHIMLAFGVGMLEGSGVGFIKHGFADVVLLPAGFEGSMRYFFTGIV